MEENDIAKLKITENIDLEEVFEFEHDGLRTGILENGLKYYVRSGSVPKCRIYASLVVKAGSTLEDVDELGIAHMLEHLVFTSVEFKDPEVRDYIEAKLMSTTGPCGANAVTSADYTFYCFPADNKEELSLAIAALAGISTEVKVCDKNLDRERGVIMNEYNMRFNNVKTSEGDAFTLLRYSGTKYEQLPIGKPEVIRGVSAEKIQKFYENWYQLHRMAVIVVGDIDLECTIDLIRTTFGPKESKELALLAPDLGIQHFREPRISCFTNPSAETAVHVSFGVERKAPKTLGDLTADWAEHVFMTALELRFDSISSDTDWAFLVSTRDVYGPEKEYYVYGDCPVGMTVERLEMILVELARIRLYGFDDDELSRAKDYVLQAQERDYLDRESLDSIALARSYLKNFVFGKACVDPRYSVQLQRTIVPVISPEEVLSFSNMCRATSNCCIMITEPYPLATQEAVKSVLEKINVLEGQGGISREAEKQKSTERILDPVPGTLLEKHDCPKLGATELPLSNGMRLCCKATDLADDLVSLLGFSFGGLSEVSEDDYISFSMAREIASLVSICGSEYHVDGWERVTFEVQIKSYQRYFQASFPSSCIEAALQLVYLLFTTNEEPEETVVKKVVDHMESMQLAKDQMLLSLNDYVMEVNAGTSFHSKPVTIDEIKRIDVLKACRYFNDCFRDPSNFFVVLVGKIDLDKASPLMLEYLAGIPKPDKPNFHFLRANLKAIPFEFPATVVRREFFNPVETAGCLMRISIPLVFKENLEVEQYSSSVLINLIQARLLKKLRFEGGQVENVIEEIESIRCEVHDHDVLSTSEPLNHEIKSNQGWVDGIIKCYWSSYYSGDLDCAFEIQRKKDEYGELKVDFARLIPFPCKERYTAVLFRPR